MTRAIVVGSSGQDGSLLFELLTDRGYEVLGVARDSCRANRAIQVPPVDISRARDVRRLMDEFRPHEVYYLPAVHQPAEMAHPSSADLWRRSAEVHVAGLLHFLEAASQAHQCTRIFYAASSHVFGDPPLWPQTEATPFNPLTVYGITKAAGVQACRSFRTSRGTFASAGILYNHESRRRPNGYISTKIVKAALDICQGRRESLVLGDLGARVDWGYAPDYVDAMTRILALDTPDDFVIASGRAHTVADFARLAFQAVGLDWTRHVGEDPKLVRPSRTMLVGDASRLRQATGWAPSVSFEEMIAHLVPLPETAGARA